MEVKSEDYIDALEQGLFAATRDATVNAGAIRGLLRENEELKKRIAELESANPGSGKEADAG